MKKKSLLFGLISLVGVVLLALPMFLSYWFEHIFVIGGYNETSVYSIFKDFSAYNANICATIVMICAIALLVVAVAYAVIFVLQLLKVGDKKLLSKIKFILLIVEAVLAIVAIICSFIFVFSNQNRFLGFAKSNIKFSGGFFMLVIGAVVLSIFGMLSHVYNKNKK